MKAFNDLIEQAFDDLGHNDHNMSRDRPYTGQPHTDTGERGRTEIKGVTFRDLRDCFIRAYCLSLGAAHPDNMPYYHEAKKGERAALCESDIYKLKGDIDPMAHFQNFSCEVERIMGIFPNVPELEYVGPADKAGESRG